MADTITANISSYPTVITASLSTYMTSISTNFVETTLKFLDGAGLNVPNTFSQNNTFLQDVSMDGNVGIGTATPNERLTVAGNISASGSLTVSNLIYTGDNIVYKGGNTDGAALTIGTNDAQDLNFETNGSTRMSITSAGGVVVNTAALLPKFTILTDLNTGDEDNSPLLIKGVGANKPAAINLRTTGGGSEAYKGWMSGVVGNGININPQLVVRNGNSGPGTGTVTLIANSSGRVGIGTETPNERLTVAGNISAVGNTFTSKLGVSANSLPANVILGVGPNLINDANLPVQYSSTTPINYIGLNAQSPGTYGGLVGYTETEYGGGLILRTVPGNKAIRFVTDNNIQRMTLRSGSGNLGIGTTEPNERLTVVGNISATGTANKLPNQLADSPESILTIGEYDEYEWYPQTTSTYDKAILNGRTLRYFQAALVIADKGTTQPFIHQPIGNRAGRFKMSIVTPTTFQYMSYDCTYYAYGTQYVGGSWNADIRRAPDVGRAWFQCTITGSPSAVVDQVITGSRGAEVTIATASTPIINSFQVKSFSNRLPSQGEIFTTDGGTFTVAAGGILGTISDAQASYTGALIPSVGIFWPTTMPDGTFYIRGHTTL